MLDMAHMVRSGLTTALLSVRGKILVARLAFDVVRASANGLLDYADMSKAAPLNTESARDYATRVLSAEIDSYLCEPIVRTMLIADSDKASKVELFSGVANIFTTKLLAVVGGQAHATRSAGIKTESAVSIGREIGPTGRRERHSHCRRTGVRL
ncbi:hypothetical protein A5742_14725 [Mycolicibacterium fortuitum]|uniref:Uncharacterized protein n=1 Tax=Mycolicibacterium fortuitum TaxID=1766 RepID=A0ABD6QCL3_MYCFO|nr:hypothetical protein [Mycolicibacterium fortuitum]OMC33144.1 hypothetical protein A5742_14725 [Mycolicibacterium fortuitum]